MTEEKNDANGGLSGAKPRKTLKLKSTQDGKKRLGLSTSSAPTKPASNAQSSTRGGTVVVVTKSKGGAGAAGAATDSLEDLEIKRKLDILKNASKNRADSSSSESDSESEDFATPIEDEQSESADVSDKSNVESDDSVNSAVPTEDEQNVDSTISSESSSSELSPSESQSDELSLDAEIKVEGDDKDNVKEEVKSMEAKDSKMPPRRSQEGRISRRNSSRGRSSGNESLRFNSKMRNLDSLGRKKPQKEEEIQKEEEKVEAIDNTANQTTSADHKNKRGGGDSHEKSRGSRPNFGSSPRLQNVINEDDEGEEYSKNANSNKKRNKNRGNSENNNTGKLSVAQFLKMEEEAESDDVFKPRGIRSIRAYKNKGKAFSKVKRDKIVQTVSIYDGITVQELASSMSEKVGNVIKKLMGLGIMATINQSLDVETAEILVGEMGHIASHDTSSNLEESVVNEIRSDEGKGYSKQKRPPIVTIMGHVDHGKTSLLDAYRNSRVVEGEAGGITQHIAAYQVEYNDNKITFLDTPGHAAFTAMRLRGAMVTDIVVIIVAADDGIMEQTVEAINHAKAAEVPIIVAINKIDKPEANADRVKNQLLSYNLIPEEMGGDIMVVQVSAAKRLNLDELLDSILLQSELIDLDTPKDRPAVGSVVESRMERLHGVTTTLLLKKGTLKIGDIIIAGESWGRVKNISNDLGKAVKYAYPSMPVEVIGLSSAPTAGDEFLVVESDKQARDIVEYRIENSKKDSSSKRSATTLESLMKSVADQEIRQLNVLIKADVHGSMEAIAASLGQIATDEVKVNIMHQAVGGVTESDVTLARASDAIIIGFNVRAPSSVMQVAKAHGVEIRYYSIIYQLIDDIKMAAAGLLDPLQTEEITGYVEIRDIFNLSKFGKVAGCYVTSGFVTRDCKLRVIRDDIVIYTGDIKALKRFKDDIKEVKSGFECGISLEKFDDIKVGDKLEAFIIKEEKRTL